ncbi:hypothetical protein AYI68_g4497 [Smittium mucronatum]|uniref:Pre-rRNA-processing protein RIX1 n=1 Tax=Smittium mucronatum TaxID=133383 RepID=A0A1R0GX21_9FUNG|nr:hypothetical protein AYI68_g4497 [Smittium mucronatum]
MKVVKSLLSNSPVFFNTDSRSKIENAVVTYLLLIESNTGTDGVNPEIDYGAILERKRLLLETLLVIISRPIISQASLIPHATRIFSTWLTSSDLTVMKTCKDGLAVLETIIHPKLPASIYPATYLSFENKGSIKDENLKINQIFSDSSNLKNSENNDISISITLEPKISPIESSSDNVSSKDSSAKKRKEPVPDIDFGKKNLDTEISLATKDIEIKNISNISDINQNQIPKMVEKIIDKVSDKTNILAHVSESFELPDMIYNHENKDNAPIEETSLKVSNFFGSENKHKKHEPKYENEIQEPAFKIMDEKMEIKIDLDTSNYMDEDSLMPEIDLEDSDSE